MDIILCPRWRFFVCSVCSVRTHPQSCCTGYAPTTAQDILLSQRYILLTRVCAHHSVLKGSDIEYVTTLNKKRSVVVQLTVVFCEKQKGLLLYVQHSCTSVVSYERDHDNIALQSPSFVNTPKTGGDSVYQPSNRYYYLGYYYTGKENG